MNICVYGAASDKIDASFTAAGEALGKALAAAGHGLVFGGGNTGMMGAVARGVAAGNGYILGVAPKFFDQEGVLYQNCTDFHFTETMRERKQYMEDHSDAFIMSPGGIGTLEEFFEILTLKTLARHAKPIVIFNVNGYFDDLCALLEKAVAEKFAAPGDLDAFLVSDQVDEIIRFLEKNR